MTYSGYCKKCKTATRHFRNGNCLDCGENDKKIGNLFKMDKPRYKEFDSYAEPVIKTFNKIPKVMVVVCCPKGDEITTGLCSDELRELADYLSFLYVKKQNKREVKPNSSQP